ncbi:MAG: deoxyhypusine synthase [Limisphaerales bacterium]|nr:MAG: deoxyhypusine synthase [Limisphaerales bacterium]KAG0508040.1 MAG: deoxyhypusine synthase [Limisphaerales bacterium]TXT52061.1 MAG: deoxyhypusine synthase [Limisphaerales bacterium]
MSKNTGHKVSKKFAAYPRLNPLGVGKDISAADLIDEVMLAYNGGRLREASQLLVKKMLPKDGFIGMSLTGALTPAGLGKSCLIPLMKGGYVDWIVSTGANLYHDLHFGLDMQLHSGSPFLDDVALHRDGVIRIYDVLFDYNVLLDTDAFVREVIQGPEFQRPMGTDEFHYLLGKYVAARGKKLGLKDSSVLATAYECGIPIFTSSPGDSSIGMNVAAMAMRGSALLPDVNRDVNQTAAIVYHAKSTGHTSSVFILGGGSPKNFMLQTEPQIQEVLGIQEKGHDYFLQVTDARPDTGGLSGATPAEAVSWGKVDPDKLPDSVVCYTDSTIALPLLTAYVLSRVKPRKLKRLYDHRDAILDVVKQKYLKSGTVTKVLTSRKIAKRSSSIGLK